MAPHSADQNGNRMHGGESSMPETARCSGPALNWTHGVLTERKRAGIQGKKEGTRRTTNLDGSTG